MGVSTDFWGGRRVLITGHTGFKGAWLSLWLTELGADVLGLSDGIPTSPSLYEAAAVGDNVASVQGDVRSIDDVGRAFDAHRPDIVLHLAAQSLVRRSFAEPLATFETNALGTANVLETMRRSETVRAAVIVTTDKVYGSHTGRCHVEDDPLGGTDLYSASKTAAEHVTSAYRASFFSGDDGPVVATARAGNVIGGGDWAADRLLPDIVAALVNGRPLEVRYPDAVRPWQHVLNPLEGYLLLAERLWDDPSCAAAWNFGPDPADSRTVEAVIRRVEELWGTTLDVRSPSLPQPAEAPSLELDASRARRVLGWAPRWPLEEGLRATVEWHRGLSEGESARTLTLAQIGLSAATTASAALR
jgi:CDP-glucose 4,6-dehydratase